MRVFLKTEMLQGLSGVVVFVVFYGGVCGGLSGICGGGVCGGVCGICGGVCGGVCGGGGGGVCVCVGSMWWWK